MAPELACDSATPKAFSISFHCFVRGRGRAPSSAASCAGKARNSSADRAQGIRCAAWEDFRAERPRSTAARPWPVNKIERGIAMGRRAGTASSHEPNSATPGRRAEGICANSILPGIFDFNGSSIAAIHAGQLMLIAAVPCNRCAETSSALKPAYPGARPCPVPA